MFEPNLKVICFNAASKGCCKYKEEINLSFIKGTGEVKRYSHCRSALLESARTPRGVWDLQMYTQRDPPSWGLTSSIILPGLEDGMCTSAFWLIWHHLFFPHALYQSISASHLWIIWEQYFKREVWVSKAESYDPICRIKSYRHVHVLGVCRYGWPVGHSLS